MKRIMTLSIVLLGVTIVLISCGASSGGSGSGGGAASGTPGSLDKTFNTTGKVTTPIGTGNDAASAVAIQADGKIVAAGYANNGSNNNFALVRYWP